MVKFDFVTKEQLEAEKAFCWQMFERLSRAWHETENGIFLEDANLYAKRASEISEALNK